MQPVQGLVNEICRLSELEHIVVVRGHGDELADKLKAAADGENTDYSNIAVLGSERTINSAAFNEIRSTETEVKAFLVGVNAGKLDDNSYIEIVEMLRAVIKLASGEEVALEGVEMKQTGPRMWVFIPEAKPMDYEARKMIYEAQKKVVTAA